MAISDANTQTRGDTIEPAASDTRNERGVARRGLVAGALAGIAAVFVGRASPAAAEDGAPLVLGTRNVASSETSLEKNPGPVSMPAFTARQGGSAAMLGNAPVDTSRFPVGTGGMPLNNAAVAAVSDGSIGVFGNAGPSGVGLWGASEGFIGSWGASLTGVGVLGMTYPSDTEQPHESVYPAAGVFGIGGRAPGTWGLSTSGPGAWGQSNTGPGVLGQTGRSAALPAVQYPTAGVYGVGGAATGVWGVSTSGIGSWGQSDSGVGVLGQVGLAANPGPTQYPASGVLGIGNGGQPGVWGKSMGGIGTWGISDTGPGVVGQTGGAAPALGATTGYPAAGVYGIGSGDKTGIWAISDSGIGEWGQSNTGIGVLGQTGHPVGGVAYPRAGVLGVDNTELNPGPPNLPLAGVWGLARGDGIGTWGQSNTGIGVSGESGHIGAWFKVGRVAIDPKLLESAAMHTTAMGTDVSTCARAEKGVALMAEVSDPAGTGLMIETPEGGVAIMAMGRLQSDQIMLANIGKAVDMVSIPCNEINAMSHVSIMLRNDIGAFVTFVELQPGVGIVVHFDRKTRNAGTLTYAVTEMMGTHQ